jgi:outer membrane protein assembly factor BamA
MLAAGRLSAQTPDTPLLGKLEAPATQEEGKQEAVRELKPEPPGSFFSRDGYTFFPLPAFAYTRNEDYWVGVLVPILAANDQGEVENILAPQYLHNRYVGENLTLSYYGYRGDTKQFRAVASYATKIEQNYDLSYRDLGAGGGKYILGAQVNWFKNAFARFFGIGNSAPEQDETNYTSREFVANLTAGINLTEDLSIVFTERYRNVRVDQGAVTSLAQTRSLFPNVTGIGGAQVLGQRLALRYDTRDSQLTPTRGSYVNASVELSQNLASGATARWGRYILDARHLVRHDTNQVFVMHFLFDAVTGDKIPFYERPTLGGENTLRAFGLSRYMDDFAVVANFENRIEILDKRILNHQINVEIAPFLDIGRVASTFDGDWFKQLQYNPGFGIRVMAKPHVVGRIDVAYGRDGSNAFVGLDYPF